MVLIAACARWTGANGSFLINTGDHLFGKADERLRALGGRVKRHAGQAITGRFRQTHVAWNHGVEYLVAKMVLQLLTHLLLQGDAWVKHHTQETDDLQVRVQIGVHLFDGVDQIGQPF